MIRNHLCKKTDYNLLFNQKTSELLDFHRLITPEVD